MYSIDREAIRDRCPVSLISPTIHRHIKLTCMDNLFSFLAARTVKGLRQLEQEGFKLWKIYGRSFKYVDAKFEGVRSESVGERQRRAIRRHWKEANGADRRFRGARRKGGRGKIAERVYPYGSPGEFVVLLVAKSNDRCTRSVISIVVRGSDRYA